MFTGILNGVFADSTYSNVTNPENYGSAHALAMGVINPTTPTSFLDGSIQEVMVFNSALSNAQCTSVTNYLNHKYNIY